VWTEVKVDAKREISVHGREGGFVYANFMEANKSLGFQRNRLIGMRCLEALERVWNAMNAPRAQCAFMQYQELSDASGMLKVRM
jgi:hypothetical protein